MTTQFDNETESSRTSGIRNRASDAYTAARERTSSAYGSVSERAGQARERASEGIESNPMGALIGGLAVGAVLGFLLPKTQREEELLGDYGRRINETAREAARAAREAGVTKLDELGYNRDNIRGKVQSLRTDAAEIASAAAQRVKGDAREVATAATQNAKETVQQQGTSGSTDTLTTSGVGPV
jgi:ElaB/YqjD/DUF883 family membrane-anchored ribosome-binding protein